MALAKSNARKAGEIVVGAVLAFAIVSLIGIALVALTGNDSYYDYTTSSYTTTTPDWAADFPWIFLIAGIAAAITICVILLVHFEIDDEVRKEAQKAATVAAEGTSTE